MCQSSLFYKTKGNASLWTKCSREDYTLLFFQQPLPPVLPFPHSPFSLANASAPSLSAHYLAFSLSSYYFPHAIFVGILCCFLHSDESQLPASWVLWHPVASLVLALLEVPRKRKYMHMLIKDTKKSLLLYTKTRKSRVWALQKKYLKGGKGLSHNLHSNFALACPKPGSRAQFFKPHTTLTRALPPNFLFAVVLESHTRLACQARQ